MIVGIHSRKDKLNQVLSALRKPFRWIPVLVFGTLILVSCADSDDESESSTVSEENTDAEEISIGSFDPTLIADVGLSEDITIIDCTLS